MTNTSTPYRTYEPMALHDKAQFCRSCLGRRDRGLTRAYGTVVVHHPDGTRNKFHYCQEHYLAAIIGPNGYGGPYEGSSPYGRA